MMYMQLVKIQYSVKNLISLNLLSSFSLIRLIEVLEIYHYNRLYFYTLKRITFKKKHENYKDIIFKVFQPNTVQILEEKGEEVLCIMTLKRDQGFWPKIISGSWVISPPIIIDENSIKISILVKDNFDEIYQKWSKIIDKIKIIAINQIENIPGENDIRNRQIIRTAQPFPHFPSRQYEIALFATRNGYYETPKKVSARAIAENFGISISAVNEHLRKAERITMNYFFS